MGKNVSLKRLTTYVRKAYARISQWGGDDSLSPPTDLLSSERTEKDMDSKTCRSCGRSIVEVDGAWVDPEATGDDSVWRETCDSNDTERAAPHEPAGPADRDGTYTPDLDDRRRIAVSELIMVAGQTGNITGRNLKVAVMHNIVSMDELDVLGVIVTERIVRIASGQSEY